MRSVRLGLLLCLLLLTVSIWGQQTQPGSAPPPAPKDPQAISVLNQALAVAGGPSAIGAITDYTATGNVTYYWGQDVQGSVTVRGLGMDEFRLDATLPSGVRSLAISGGVTTTRAEGGTISQVPSNGPIPSSNIVPYQAPMFPGSLPLPSLQLVAILSRSDMAVSDNGVVQVNGLSLRDIHVQEIPPVTTVDVMSQYRTRDFFIDPATLQLVMMQEMIPRSVVHQVWYSDTTVVNGIAVPFSISEQMGGQKTWEITLSQISFNTGLQDSDFVLQ